MANIHLKLNRGATHGTIDLNDNANYQLWAGWAPRVARRRDNALGGRTPIANVVESIPLRVFGLSAADALEALENLAEAIEQAEAWNSGGELDPVLLEYLPTGSSLSSALQVAVLGSPDDASDLLSLPITFNEKLHVYEIYPVSLNLLRHGLWLGDTETDTSGAAVTQPAVMSVSLTDVPIISPADVTVTFGKEASRPPGFTEKLLLLAGSTDRLAVIEAEDMTTTAFTSVADATNYASGGSVLRFTPVSTAPDESDFADLSASFDPNARLFAIYAAIRNNTAGKTYTARVLSFAANTSIVDAQTGETRYTTIPYTDGNPKLVFLGVLATAQPLGGIVLEFEPDATGGTLDIDVVVVQALDEYARAVEWKTVDQSRGTALVNPAEDAQLILEHQMLELPQPVARIDFDDHSFYPGHEGDALALMKDQLAAVLLTVGIVGALNHWRHVYNLTPATATLSVTRRQGYLVPR